MVNFVTRVAVSSGGLKRVVWMPKELKEALRSQLEEGAIGVISDEI